MGRFPGWNTAQDFPDALLEVGAANVEWQRARPFRMIDGLAQRSEDILQAGSILRHLGVRKALPQALNAPAFLVHKLKDHEAMFGGSHKELPE
jgi:hypothetical protein